MFRICLFAFFLLLFSPTPYALNVAMQVSVEGANTPLSSELQIYQTKSN